MRHTFSDARHRKKGQNGETEKKKMEEEGDISIHSPPPPLFPRSLSNIRLLPPLSPLFLWHVGMLSIPGGKKGKESWKKTIHLVGRTDGLSPSPSRLRRRMEGRWADDDDRLNGKTSRNLRRP